MHHPRSFTVRLPSGGCHPWRAVAGTELIVAHGTARLLEACRPVAGHVLQRVVLLECGSMHRIDSTGWVALSTRAGCELRVLVPTPVTLAGAWRAVGRMVQWLRAPATASRT